MLMEFKEHANPRDYTSLFDYLRDTVDECEGSFLVVPGGEVVLHTSQQVEEWLDRAIHKWQA